MKRKICELILILFFYLLQSTLGRAISIGGISPNFLIILPVVFGFLKGKNEGIYVGFMCGLMYDLFTYDIIGFSSIMLMIAGYWSGFYCQEYNETEMIIPMAIFIVSSFGFGFISYVGNFLLHNKLDVMYYVTRIIIPETIYTLVVTIVIYKPLVFINSKFDKKDKRSVAKID